MVSLFDSVGDAMVTYFIYDAIFNGGCPESDSEGDSEGTHEDTLGDNEKRDTRTAEDKMTEWFFEGRVY